MIEDLMQKLVHPKIRDKMLKTNVEVLLFDWLTLCDQQNQIYTDTYRGCVSWRSCLLLFVVVCGL